MAEPEAGVYNCELNGTVWFGFGSYINSGAIRSYVEVGRYSSIGRDVSLGLAHHDMTQLSTSPFFGFEVPGSLPLASTEPKRRVVIGSDCWVGDSVRVVSGVTVGHGSVIGTGAVVTKDVPPYAVVGGVPARLIRWRFDETMIERLLALRWWRYEPSDLRRALPSGSMPDALDFLEELASAGRLPVAELPTVRIKPEGS